MRLLGDRELQEFEFFVTVPGLIADWQRVDFDSLYAPDGWFDIQDPVELRREVEAIGCCTTKKNGQGSGDPINLGHAICIDTFAHGGGWLSCLDVKSGQLWRANQKGKCGVGWIDEIHSGVRST